MDISSAQAFVSALQIPAPRFGATATPAKFDFDAAQSQAMVVGSEVVSFVSGISVGDGSGAGSSFNAYVDHVALTTDSGTTMYNFKAAVPEPATWGMMLLGFAGIGMALRRRRSPALAQIA